MAPATPQAQESWVGPPTPGTAPGAAGFPLTPQKLRSGSDMSLGCVAEEAKGSTAAKGGRAAVPALELKRLVEAEAMIARFSRENEYLAMQNNQLRTHRKHVDTDYVGTLEEVDWLRNKLEGLETALRASVVGKARSGGQEVLLATGGSDPLR